MHVAGDSHVDSSTDDNLPAEHTDTLALVAVGVNIMVFVRCSLTGVEVDGQCGDGWDRSEK